MAVFCLFFLSLSRLLNISGPLGAGEFSILNGLGRLSDFDKFSQRWQCFQRSCGECKRLASIDGRTGETPE